MRRNPSRRTFLAGAIMSGAGALAPSPQAAAATQARTLSAQPVWVPPPAQVRVVEGVAALRGGARLWYWDTGGKGETVVLLHPASGSGAVWEYQQPVLAAAGYRVIGYSRRGFYRSEAGTADPGTASGDLHELAEYLGIDRFHLVGSAAGGFVVPDYALSYPQKLLSMVIACSLGGVEDAEYQSVTRRLLPDGFSALPVEFRELGPSFRAAHAAGVARWLELHRLGRAENALRQRTANRLSWSAIETLRTPTLLLTGDADPYMPPSRLRGFASRIPDAEVAVIDEAGHSAHWEQPAAFNRAVLAFLAKHRRSRS